MDKETYNNICKKGGYRELRQIEHGDGSFSFMGIADSVEDNQLEEARDYVDRQLSSKSKNIMKKLNNPHI